jgi:hypothetical protein
VSSLKKFIITFTVLLWTFTSSFTALAFSSNNNIKYKLINTYTPPKHSTEELYQDIFVLLLLPNIQEAVNNYYKEYLSVLPMVAPYDITVLSAERVGGYRAFDFRLKLQLRPYVAPHNDVGLDNITISIKPSNNINVEKYEHIKSYNLPPYYSNIIKKNLP